MDPDWESRLHDALGKPWPCEEQQAFADLWGRIEREVPEIGKGHDVDLAVARAAWCICRHVRPATVVETGVARGLSSRVILEALVANGTGQLQSLDLPPMLEGWDRQVGALVPEALRPRWTYVRGSSRRWLPRVLGELGPIDVFSHSSSLTEPNARFEFERGYEALRHGGVLLAEGINGSRAFATVFDGKSVAARITARCERKPYLFGIVVKGS
jgi:hypothetical protein